MWRKVTKLEVRDLFLGALVALGTLEPLEDSPLISLLVSPEEIGNLHGGNEISPPRGEIKLRKNGMKLRKNEMKVRKNSFVPRWINKNLHRGIARFPPVRT